MEGISAPKLKLFTCAPPIVGVISASSGNLTLRQFRHLRRRNDNISLFPSFLANPGLEEVELLALQKVCEVLDAASAPGVVILPNLRHLWVTIDDGTWRGCLPKLGRILCSRR